MVISCFPLFLSWEDISFLIPHLWAGLHIALTIGCEASDMNDFQVWASRGHCFCSPALNWQDRPTKPSLPARSAMRRRAAAPADSPPSCHTGDTVSGYWPNWFSRWHEWPQPGKIHQSLLSCKRPKWRKWEQQMTTLQVTKFRDGCLAVVNWDQFLK